MTQLFMSGVGWFIALCMLLNQVGLIEFSLHLSAPAPQQCPKEQPVQPKLNHPVLDQLKRNAKKLTKTQPLTHSQAIEKLARLQGFKSYAAMRAAFKDATT